MGNRQIDQPKTLSNFIEEDNSLPGFTFEYEIGYDLINEPFCCICFHDYYQGMPLQILPCNHIIHKDCMIDWYKRSKTCPLCRTKL